MSPPPADLSISTRRTLPNSSATIPILGLGVYQSPAATCANSVLHALKSGYRHIDTAQFYRNEASVGEALARASKELNIPRSDIFVTTKILSPGGSIDAAYQKCIESVAKIDPDTEERKGYVDLFLIHDARNLKEERKYMWKALEQLKKEGRAKSIGVSNYGVGHIEELKTYAAEGEWPPSCNQLELHPWCQQRVIVDYCNRNNIVLTAYSPLVRNQKSANETLNTLAKHKNVTPAQILIRYALQKGWIPLPKSDDPGRIQTNADVFGFELESEEMTTLNDLDQGDYGAIVQAVRNDLR